jgi:Rieske 2Fe-2S protein
VKAWHEVGSLADVEREGRIVARIGGREIGVVRDPKIGALYALRNRCPHSGAPSAPARFAGARRASPAAMPSRTGPSSTARGTAGSSTSTRDAASTTSGCASPFTRSGSKTAASSSRPEPALVRLEPDRRTLAVAARDSVDADGRVLEQGREGAARLGDAAKRGTAQLNAFAAQATRRNASSVMSARLSRTTGTSVSRQALGACAPRGSVRSYSGARRHRTASR